MLNVAIPLLPSRPITPPGLPQCSPCLEPVSSDGVTTRCNHVFHTACLVQWLDQPNANDTCPNCRAEDPLPQYTAYKKTARNIKLITRLVTCSFGAAAIYQGNKKMQQTVTEAGKALLVPLSLQIFISSIYLLPTLREDAPDIAEEASSFAEMCLGIIANGVVGSVAFGSIIDDPRNRLIAGALVETLFSDLVSSDQILKPFFKLPCQDSKIKALQKTIKNCLMDSFSTAACIALYYAGKTLAGKASKTFFPTPQHSTV